MRSADSSSGGLNALSSYHPGRNRSPVVIRNSRRTTLVHAEWAMVSRPGRVSTGPGSPGALTSVPDGVPGTVLPSGNTSTWSTTSTSGRVAASLPRTAATAPGDSQSSPSTNQTYSPWACASPMLRARDRPTLTVRWTTRTRGSWAAYRSATAPVSSGEASSTTTTSSASVGSARIESRQAVTYPAVR